MDSRMNIILVKSVSVLQSSQQFFGGVSEGPGGVISIGTLSNECLVVLYEIVALDCSCTVTTTGQNNYSRVSH